MIELQSQPFNQCSLIQLNQLISLLDDRQIKLVLDEAARNWFADRGFDPIYGARPLKRVIQRSLQIPLANLILQGNIGDGDSVSISVGDEGLLINGQHAETV